MPPGDGNANGPSGETPDWSDGLAYEGDSEIAVPEYGDGSERWNRWHYGIYVGVALLLFGVARSSLALMLPGYLLVPIAMYLDSRYLESVTPRWDADTGLYVIGSLLFPVLVIPMYLYWRRELRIAE
jgi:hypothetical protein